MADFFKIEADDPITEGANGDVKVVFIGIGTHMQLSKMLSRKSELAIRYASVRPDKKINEYENRLEEAAFGYSKYLHGHRIKVQGNLG
jgi:phosphate-selective porin OprO/OprP